MYAACGAPRWGRVKEAGGRREQEDLALQRLEQAGQGCRSRRTPVRWLGIVCALAQVVPSFVSAPAAASDALPALRSVRAAASTGLHGGHRVQTVQDLEELGPGSTGSPEAQVAAEASAAKSRAVEDYLMDLHSEGGWEGLDQKAGRQRLERLRVRLSRKHKITPPVSALVRAYHSLVAKGVLAQDHSLSTLLVRKECRSWSGVLVVTLFTAPGNFSCPMDCHYCPDERDSNGTQLLPRSYLSTEPGCKRGMANGWDCVRQFRDRVSCLRNIGHKVDKIEVLVLGGTWSFYPVEYQEDFIRDIYFAANTLDVGEDEIDSRARRELLCEQAENQDARYKIIGITLETRPDFITRAELRRFRRYGCTRVQIGLQHTDDAILALINRQCTNEQGERAIKALKEACFKVDVHIMPDLPGSSPQLDREMLSKVLWDEKLDADYYKIYPTAVTPFTKIEEWFREGKYRPYADDDNGAKLIGLLVWFKEHVQEWKRINRIPRDIPNQSIIAGNNKTNLRQLLLQEMRVMRDVPAMREGERGWGREGEREVWGMQALIVIIIVLAARAGAAGNRDGGQYRNSNES